ncbi:MAG: hypothetical protein MZV63_09160 [Marinilabiliales bacterium]|nr:hypothetical protein [Marinilabiliales bacterium]
MITAKLRALFGEMLREVQRIKSEGDFEAGTEYDRKLRCEDRPGPS